MSYAQIQSGQPVPLQPGQTITYQDVQFSYATMLLWSDAERKAFDIYTITDDAMPAGKIATGSTLEFKGGKVLRHWTLADAPTPVLLTNKADIWRRATDDERVALDAALAEAPAFLRQLYAAVTVIDHSAPEFSTLRDAVAATPIGAGTIGYTRADVLLAAS